MLEINGSPGLRRIVVLNPKGGAGKTTLAFNVAGFLAATGRRVALIDMDQQGSSSHWLGRRPAEFPSIHGVSASSARPGAHTNLRITLPPEIDFAVVDAPAGIARDELADFTAGSHAIIVPVMPSELDIHAASRLIADLLLAARVSRENGRLGVIANRVKERTVAYQQLRKFLDRLSIPVVGVIRDSQNYVSAAREGLCIHELPHSKAAKDLERWEPVIRWLEQRLETPLNERDLLRPKAGGDEAGRPTIRLGWKPATAAALVSIAAVALLWSLSRTSDDDLSVPPAAAGNATVHEDADDARPPPASVAEAAPVVEMPSVSAPAETQPGNDEPPRTPDAASRDAGLGAVTPAGAATVAAIDRAAEDGAGDAEPAPQSHGVAAVADKPSEHVAAESDSPEPERLRTPDARRHKWRLRGVVRSGGTHVILLTDLSDSSTRTVSVHNAVDGWLVKDAGRDFAVLVKDGEEVRLQLSKHDGS